MKLRPIRKDDVARLRLSEREAIAGAEPKVRTFVYRQGEDGKQEAVEVRRDTFYDMAGTALDNANFPICQERYEDGGSQQRVVEADVFTLEIEVDRMAASTRFAYQP